ncbi:hypothetical protein M0Q50_00020 [bacterium]|jgi:hypothetical protein|nr:hypothetical protein [bacterium]
MDAVTKELIAWTRNFLLCRKFDLKEAERIFEKLIEVEEIKVKEMDRNDGSIHPSRLPNEYRSLSRITYIIKKWYFARVTGKEETIDYVFNEEDDEKRKKSLFNEKIIFVPSRP